MEMYYQIPKNLMLYIQCEAADCHCNWDSVHKLYDLDWYCVTQVTMTTMTNHGNHNPNFLPVNKAISDVTPDILTIRCHAYN